MKRRINFSDKKLVFILFLMVFLVYANALFNGFVWDDFDQVVDNRVIQSFSNFPLFFGGSTAAESLGRFYRPMMSLFFAICWQVGGGKPFVFHLFQVGLHVVNTILMFLIFKKLFRNLKLEIRNWSQRLAFLGALLWGVHPVNVESVGYISGVNEALFVFFLLLSFLLVLKNKSWVLWAGGFSFFLSLLSKESALMAGIVILFYLFCFERKKLLKWLGVYILAVGLYLWLHLGVAKISFATSGITPIMEASLKERLLTVPWEFFSYLRLIFFPKVLAVSQHFVVKTPTLGNFWLPLVVDLGFLAVLSFFGFKLRSKLYWFFCAWLLLPIGLVLNITPLGYTIAERWLYFPLMGFLGTLGCLSMEAWKVLERKKKLRKWTVGLMVVILVALSLRTIKRNFDWQTPLKLYSHDIQYSRDSFDLENNLGAELFKISRLNEAKKHFERSIELQPKAWRNYNNLAVVSEKEGDLEKAENFYRRAIENGKNFLDWGNTVGYENLFFILLKRGKDEEGEKILQEGILKYPKSERLNQLIETYWRKKLKLN